MTRPPSSPRCAVCGAFLTASAETLAWCDGDGQPVAIHLRWRECFAVLTGQEWTPRREWLWSRGELEVRDRR